MILIKFFLTGYLYDRFKLRCVYLNEEDKFRECYTCLNLMIQVHLQVVFFTIFFIKHILLKMAPKFEKTKLFKKGLILAINVLVFRVPTRRNIFFYYGGKKGRFSLVFTMELFSAVLIFHFKFCLDIFYFKT